MISRANLTLWFLGPFLAGLAMAQTADTSSPTPAKRIAVISLTAQTFERKFSGMTVFGNELETKDISDWNLDEHYEQLFANELRDAWGFTPVRVANRGPEFAKIHEPRWGTLDPDSPNWPGIEPAVKAACAEGGLDALMVVARSSNQDRFSGGTNQFLRGAGIYSRGSVYKFAFLHVIARVALFDCSTGKPKKTSRLAGMPEATFATQIFGSLPLEKVEYEAALRPMAQWTPEQFDRYREQLLELPRKAIAPTLKNIFAAPPPDSTKESAPAAGMTGN